MSYRSTRPIVIGDGLPSKNVRERFLSNKMIEALIEKDNICTLIDIIKIRANVQEKQKARYQSFYDDDDSSTEDIKEELRKLYKERRKIMLEIGDIENVRRHYGMV